MGAKRGSPIRCASIARCPFHLRPNGAARALYCGRARKRRGPIHFAHLCRAGQEGAPHDQRAHEGGRAMATELNRRSIPTPAGGTWHAMQVLRVWARLKQGGGGC